MDYSKFYDFVNEYVNENTSNNSNSNSSNNNSDLCGNDIPNGFQAENPQLILLVGEILGNLISQNLPFNLQNVIGNWLQLVGQVIETYNAQQQYMQAGPGRYYDIRNLNVNNPFCQNNYEVQTDESGNSVRINPKSDTSSSSSTDVEELKGYVLELRNEVKSLKKEIKNLKNEMENT